MSFYIQRILIIDSTKDHLKEHIKVKTKEKVSNFL